MALPIIKGTMFFTANNRGWTESWWTNRVTGNLLDAFNLLRTVCRARANLLGRGAELTAARVSNEQVLNDSYVEYLNASNADETPQDLADLDIGILTTAADVANTHRKHTFLRGFYDSIEVDGGKFIGKGSAAFTRQFQAYVDALKIGQWGWPGVGLKFPSPLTGYSLDADQRITFVATNPIFGIIPFGQPTKVRVGFVTGSQRVNGEHLVIPLTINTCRTVYPLAVSPGGSGGRITAATQIFYQMDTLRAERIAPRKSGAPLLQPAGRRRGQGRV